MGDEEEKVACVWCVRGACVCVWCVCVCVGGVMVMLVVVVVVVVMMMMMMMMMMMIMSGRVIVVIGHPKTRHSLQTVQLY